MKNQEQENLQNHLCQASRTFYDMELYVFIMYHDSYNVLMTLLL